MTLIYVTHVNELSVIINYKLTRLFLDAAEGVVPFLRTGLGATRVVFGGHLVPTWANERWLSTG